jgi:uncharacterized phage-associated protein
MPDQLTCHDVANYFLLVSREPITNFKLQKLLYYTQGFHLVLFHEPLFNESLEARQHGPVIPALFEKYQIYESNPIDRPENLGFLKYSEDIKKLLNAVLKEYGKFSAGQLRDMVHEEMPWINGSKSESKTISNTDLKQYFITQIEDGQIKSRG